MLINCLINKLLGFVLAKDRIVISLSEYVKSLTPSVIEFDGAFRR